MPWYLFTGPHPIGHGPLGLIHPGQVFESPYPFKDNPYRQPLDSDDPRVLALQGVEVVPETPPAPPHDTPEIDAEEDLGAPTVMSWEAFKGAHNDDLATARNAFITLTGVKPAWGWVPLETAYRGWSRGVGEG